MIYRTLGRTGIRVSLASFGSGGPSNLGQHRGTTASEQDALVMRCLDLGINLFDTSKNYGDSEQILGRALRGVPRDSYHLVTKWWGDHDVDLLPDGPEVLRASVERSLTRLRTDYVDVMMLHGPLPGQYGQMVDRYYPELDRLRQEGKVRFTGFSERFYADPEHLLAETALGSGPELWDVVMLKYGILNQYAAKVVLPLAQQHAVGIINMAAVRVKLPDPVLLEELVADWKARGLVPADAVPDKDPLGWLVHGDVTSVVGAAYSFAADHPAVSTVLTGTSRIEHLEQNLAALERPCLPEANTRRIVELFSHIAEYA
jgi:L-galactose dehydrogenase